MACYLDLLNEFEVGTGVFWKLVRTCSTFCSDESCLSIHVFGITRIKVEQDARIFQNLNTRRVHNTKLSTHFRNCKSDVLKISLICRKKLI